VSKIKAVVLEKSGSRYTVLGQDGTFRQVHRRLNAEVGEEVDIQSWAESLSGVRIWAGAVALFLLVITTLLGWNLYQAPTAVALLSVDINPSLQLALDNQGHLLKFQTQDEDATRLLSQINLKGKSIEEVLEQIVSQAYDQKFLSSEQQWVVIGYSPMTSMTLVQMPKELNEHQISLWITEAGERKGLTPQVAVFSLTPQERELAQQRDLTLGEYALWQTAEKAGVVTQPEKLKDTSERVRLLENPQVQVQIKAEKKEPESSLPQKLGTSKQDSGSKVKQDENGKEKLPPVGKQFSPIRGLYPWIDTSRSKVGDKNRQKDQEIDKAKDEDKQRAKDQGLNNAKAGNQPKDQGINNNNVSGNGQDKQKANDKENNQNNDLKKDLNKAKNSENIETQRTKYDHILVPQILTSRNLSRDTSRTYKFSEYDDRDK
jgi:hypothetical protein